MSEETHSIGTLNESPLHAGLKAWYARKGDRLEVPVDGYVIDIVRGDLLIEIQTCGILAIRDKLRELSQGHPVRLVCPVACDKWLVKLPEAQDAEPERRLSPKHCTAMHIFDEMIRLPRLLRNPNFSLHVLEVQMEEVRRREPGKAWRRNGWVVQDRRLVDVVDSHLYKTPGELAALLPGGMPDEFTTADISDEAGISRKLAQKACYCLKKMGAIEHVGMQGRAYLYRAAG
jgi:hypothetical protein